MKTYIILLRGVNVGGKNPLSMAKLQGHLTSLGFLHVTTYIASGNVLLASNRGAQDIRQLIETSLPKAFKLHSELIKVLVLDRQQLQAVIDDKPKGFGDHPELYHSDVVFLMGVAPEAAWAVFRPREGVDTIWHGEGVIYSQRLSAERTKSRLSSIVGTPAYQSMTIRTWNTVIKLLKLATDLEAVL